MAKSRLLAASLCLSSCLTLGLLGPARATAEGPPEEQAVLGCTRPAAAPDDVIASCSALLASGALEGHARAVALARRGYAYHRKGDDVHAVADYTERLKAEPDDAGTLLNRGDALRNLKENSRAIA